MTSKNSTLVKQSVEKLREQVLDQLRVVGVQEGARKPGDGRYSALLKKPSK